MVGDGRMSLNPFSRSRFESYRKISCVPVPISTVRIFICLLPGSGLGDCFLFHHKEYDTCHGRTLATDASAVECRGVPGRALRLDAREGKFVREAFVTLCPKGKSAAKHCSNGRSTEAAQDFNTVA